MEYTTNSMKSTFLYLACILLACRVSAQLPPSFGNLPRPAATSSPNCNYLLSAGTPGSCVITTVDVERKLDLLKDGISRQRLQFVAHNSVIQSQITDLQNRDKQFALQIDGIRRDLLALSARGGSSSAVPSSGVSSANLNQLRAALTQAINTVDNKLTNLSVGYQRDAQSQSRTNAALQSQLSQVTRENQQLKSVTSTLSMQIQQLASQLRGLAASQAAASAAPPPTTTSPPPTTTTTAAPTSPATQPAGPTINPAVINSILQSIQTLTTSSNQNAVDITKLKALQSTVTNNTKGIIDLSAELRQTNVILANTTRKTDGVYNWLQGFQQQTLPTIQTDINNLKAFSSNLSNGQKALQATVTGLQNDFVVGQARQDQAINDLAQGITSSLGTNVQIRTQLNSLQQKIRNTLKPTPIITPPLISSKTTPSIVLPPTIRPRPGK